MNIQSSLCSQCSDPLGQALLMAFHARSRLLEKSGKNLDNAHEILDYCDKGGALLNESLAFSSLHPHNHLLKVIHACYIRHVENHELKKYIKVAT
jgi:hypothetical protein